MQEGKVDVWGGFTNNWEKISIRKGERSERERYTQQNVDVQRITRRDEAFWSEQWKEIEENNRMGKARNLFKIIRDTKGIFHAKMGPIKGRNGMGRTEAEDIKMRWQDYTEELYKDLNHQRRLSIKDLMPLNCGVGEVSWKSHGLPD